MKASPPSVMEEQVKTLGNETLLPFKAVNPTPQKASKVNSRESAHLPLISRPKRHKCKRCAGTGQRIIHCMTVTRCRYCDGRGYFLEGDLT